MYQYLVLVCLLSSTLTRAAVDTAVISCDGGVQVVNSLTTYAYDTGATGCTRRSTNTGSLGGNNAGITVSRTGWIRVTECHKLVAGLANGTDTSTIVRDRAGGLTSIHGNFKHVLDQKVCHTGIISVINGDTIRIRNQSGQNQQWQYGDMWVTLLW